MSKCASWLSPVRELTRRGQAAQDHLIRLQGWQLKHLARNTGITPGRKKANTAFDLLARLDTPNGHELYKSVDMGVKNLAVCVVRPHGSSKGPSSAYFSLELWERSDILTGRNTSAESEDSSDSTAAATESTTNAYSPRNLAPHAARVAFALRNDHDPSHILIERQRFRSMGGAAVQEWTLRVNSLEAMLWASLETLRQEQHRRQTPSTPGRIFFPEVIEMNPARIAAFWNARGSNWSLEEEDMDRLIPDASSATRKEADSEDPAKRGMEKSEKISLVRNWLQSGALDVKPALQPLASAFMQTGRAKKADGDIIISKKDDLADTCVQAVTWGLWQRNRQTLTEYLTELPGVKEAT
ncbi:hypothetical protein CAC42_1460 [Sphaceloma murrayae]|uniref:Mitochondrial resolvase Ydc2 catalytic domain-containing protein n=1 Tax=Sphaceloma murrayae TaxID=2082308 RepID=A0A2K1QYN6_9PEZI|nr:hypothetical protein CAC42_1460 [Sphaceloma murrayae]